MAWSSGAQHPAPPALPFVLAASLSCIPVCLRQGDEETMVKMMEVGGDVLSRTGELSRRADQPPLAVAPSLLAATSSL